MRVLVAGAAVALIAAGVAFGSSSRAAVVPGNSSLPTISGTATVGATLEANPGTWTGSAPLTFQYQWLSCDTAGAHCAPIPGATGQSYLLVSKDAGATVVVQVIASNGDGSATAQSANSSTIAAPTALSSTAPPAISGTMAVGSTLTTSNGTWTGSTPITYAYEWLSCDTTGASCSPISGATAQTYVAQSSDLGKTVRVQVTATNAGGSATAQSAQTATISSSTASGCPNAPSGQTVPVTQIQPPARLQVSANPTSGTITAQTQTVTVAVHVTDTCGHPVSGAQVYATAVPYSQFTIPPLQTSDSNGNVTLTFNRASGFPAARNQQLLVLFIRAVRPGDPLLAGISTRRLVSMPVKLG